MDLTLKQWASKNGKSNTTAWREFNRGKIPNSFKNNRGKIFIRETNATVSNAPESFSGVSALSLASDMRRNRSATIERTDKYVNIENGIAPVSSSNVFIRGRSGSNIDISDAISLCQKAYYNFSAFRNVIDVMTEFSVSPIYFIDGNKKSREFFKYYFDAINILDLQDKFFREFYRSGNVFVFPYEGRLTQEDLRSITNEYGLSLSATKVTLPVKYSVMNPVDIQTDGNGSFLNTIYYKKLTDYELAKLKDPSTEKDKKILESLPKNVRDEIQKGSNLVLVPVDVFNIYGIFYKKQDYEPFAVPMGFPVLEDINFKAEMKKMDMALMRTTTLAILLVTNGAKPEDGGINYKAHEALKEILKNESVGHVLVADHTTKAEFIIPDIGDILNPQKYEVVERDIQLGLNNILVGDQKFANQFISVKIFCERLKQARESFLINFLTPEIKRISKLLGFKNIPVPVFQDLNLEDDNEFKRICTRLAEIGFLTPEETFEAIETKKFPTIEESEQSQEEFVKKKKKGYYEPVAGGPFSHEKLAEKREQKKMAAMPGRPTGVGKPVKKTIKPQGSKAVIAVSDLRSVFYGSAALEKQVHDELKKKFQLENLTPKQISVANQIAENIMVNEPIDCWSTAISEYLESPKEKDPQKGKILDELMNDHGLSRYAALVFMLTAKQEENAAQ